MTDYEIMTGRGKQVLSSNTVDCLLKALRLIANSVASDHQSAYMQAIARSALSGIDNESKR